MSLCGTGEAEVGLGYLIVNHFGAEELKIVRS